LPASPVLVAVHRLRRLLSSGLDVLMPPQCLCCGRIVEKAQTLCPACWPRLHFIDGPRCAVCGVPFEVDLGEGAICGECARSRPPYGRARAVLVYDDGSKPLILKFKQGDRGEAAVAYGHWMARAGAEILADADLLVPVPLHWTRLFARRYNQAALLAYAVGRLSGVSVAPDLLVRRKRTPKLGTLGPSARRRAVQSAIAIHPRQRHRLRGRRVVVIDDVHTTGATLAACVRVLLAAGAGNVDVLTLARTVRAEPT
ncbi:MAG: double zinc ribbon domain-containing protein, partial [Rhodoplanes sp.]